MADEAHTYANGMLAELEELRVHSEAKADLLRRFEEAKHALPAGHAVVLAAGDCGRAGSKYPIPAKDLIGLARDYFTRLWPGKPVGDDEMRAGIDWAASCEEGQLPLLILDGDDAYRVSPAISGRMMGLDAPPIPPETWDWLLAHLPPMRLLQLGDTTRLFGDEEMTERAWTRAFETGDQVIQAAASVALGVLYADWDDERAITVLERADVSVLDHSAQGVAALTLGVVYERQGDVERARSHYQQAIDADSWQASPQAGYNLGALLGKLGDADGAEAAFLSAIEARVYPYRALAVLTLAATLHSLGELDRAEPYYERAIASEDIIDDVSLKAALGLGRLHEERGATDQALATYERALTGCDAALVAEAIWRYTRLAAPKEHVEPIAIYQRLLGRLRNSMAISAICRLGVRLHYQGEPATAALLLEQAMASGEGHGASEAAFLRGVFAHRQDDAAARAAYQRAIDSHHPEYAAKAANNLSVLLAEHGEEDEALATLQLARDCWPHGMIAAKAAYNSALIFERTGRVDEARAAFEQAIDPDHPGLLPSAVANLARLLTQAGEKDAAEALVERWCNDDDPILAADVADEITEFQTNPDLELLLESW